MKKLLIIITILLSNAFLFSQTITGMVMFENDKRQMEPIPYASIKVENSEMGTQADDQGKFSMQLNSTNPSAIIISAIGFFSDTIPMKKGETFFHVMLKENNVLDEVEIKQERNSTSVNTINPINLETLGTGELKKAACCNLSESFETNATVDAEYSDAITGAKTIRMLGLDGVYAQIMTENMPTVRGLAAPYGLTYIPGSWIESIQVSKGVGSVVNGYESITGSINTELKKPFETEEEKFLVNIYGSTSGRAEANINYHALLNEHFSTSILTHTSILKNKMDHNDDVFLDAPLTENYIFMNRWNYSSGKIYEAQAGIKLISSDMTGGQMSFNPAEEHTLENGYGVGISTKRYEAYIKNGFVFGRPNTSIGTIISGAYHNTDNFYGLTNYSGQENYLQANVIGQTYIGNTNHLLKAGFSYMYDDYNEVYDSVNYMRTEKVPGVFAEYFYKKNDTWNILIGNRVDFHNLYGMFYSPRIHIKYSFTPETTLRIAGGKGYRVANIFAENTSILTSSRTLVISESLQPEEAWNYGISFIRSLVLFNHEGRISADVFRTDFENQVVVDVDSDAEKIIVSNLHGKSYSIAAQVEMSYEPIKNLDLKAAYKYVNANTTYHDTLMQVPLTFKNRGLLNASYKTNRYGWVFDATAQFYGKSRLPDLTENHDAHEIGEYSPAYTLILAQITKKWKQIEVYAGTENLTNYTQHNPIISADDPFGEFFDAGVVYAPLMERKFYFGLRYQLKK